MFLSSMSWGYLENKAEENDKATYLGSKNVKRNSDLWVSPTCMEKDVSFS